MAEIVILDVGHGNCAILLDAGAVTLLDAPTGASHIEELRARGIGRVDTVLISHADADHCGGVLTLLLDETIRVGRVLLNPDAAKRSKVWDQLQMGLRDAERRHGTRPEIGITTTTRDIDAGHTHLRIEVLAPHPTLVAKGPGSEHNGRSVTSNTASAVVRVTVEDVPVALFAGDIDWVALEDLVASKGDARAQLLVYPHHGGLPAGGSAGAFAERLCALVQPRTVVFSTGRGHGGTPREEVIFAVRRTLGDVRILCTQLSAQCATLATQDPPTHLNSCCSRGASSCSACAGSLALLCNGGETRISPEADDHAAFIAAHAPTALCRRPLRN